MTKVTKKIRIDLANQGGLDFLSTIHAVQGDAYSRLVAFELYNGGEKYTPPEGTTAIVRYRKEDGTRGNYDVLPDGSSAYTINGNMLTVALAPQLCVVPGLVQLAVGLISGNAEINTFSVRLVVQPNPGITYQSESHLKLAGTVADSGWEPNVYLGTDDDGNVTALGSTDKTLTQSGRAADAKATGDAVGELKEDLDTLNITSIETTNNDWDSLILTAESNVNWGSNKKFEKGFVQSVKLKLINSAINSKLYIVEVDDNEKVLKNHKYIFSETSGIKNIPVNVYCENNFYVFTNAPVAYIIQKSVYLGGYYREATTSNFPIIKFENDFQFAIAVIKNKCSKNTSEIIKTENKINGNIIIDGIVPKDVMDSVYSNGSDNSIWVSNKIYKPGYLKSIVLTVTGSEDVLCNVYIYKRNNDGTYTMIVTSNNIGHGNVEVVFNKYIDTEYLIGVQGNRIAFFEDTYYGLYLSGTTALTTFNPVDVCNTHFTHKYYIILGNIENSISYLSKNIYIDDIGLKNTHIAFIGDSIVEGYGCSNYNGGESGTSGHLIPNNVKTWYRNTGDKCWVNKMIAYLTSNYSNVTACNNGIGGFTSDQLYNNLETLTMCDDNIRANIVILSIGTNDLYTSDKIKSITEPIEKIIRWLVDRNIIPIVLTNTPILEGNTPNNDMTIHSAIIKATENMNVPVFDVMTEVNKYLWQNNIPLEGSLDQNHYMFDNLHPSDIGYEAMFNIIKYLLKV